MVAFLVLKRAGQAVETPQMGGHVRVGEARHFRRGQQRPRRLGVLWRKRRAQFDAEFSQALRIPVPLRLFEFPVSQFKGGQARQPRVVGLGSPQSPGLCNLAPQQRPNKAGPGVGRRPAGGFQTLAPHAVPRRRVLNGMG